MNFISRKHIKRFFLLLISPILFLVLYGISIFIISYIPVNGSNGDDITIFVSSNGVHLDIVVPSKNEYYDWTNTFPQNHFNAVDSNFKYLSFGWGNQAFYLETPEWSDLKVSTAFNAMFGLGNAAMHVTYFKDIMENEQCIPIKINYENYSKLINYIKDYLIITNQKAEQIPNSQGYSYNDAFYKAGGSYNLFFTCNTWVNQALKKSGLRASLWTIFDKPILFHCKK